MSGRQAALPTEETDIQIALICTSWTTAATRRDWRQIGRSGASRIAFSPVVRPGGLGKCAWSWSVRDVADGPLGVAGVSQPCGVSGQPVLVRAAELVPVTWAGRDDVGTAVIGCVKPAHLGRGDDDAAGHVVGDQPQEPGQFLAVKVAGRRPQMEPDFVGRHAVVGQDAGPVGRGGQRRSKLGGARGPPGAGPRGRHDHKLARPIAALERQKFREHGQVPAHELGVLLLVIGVALRTRQAVEAHPAVTKAAAQLIADRPAITPCPGPQGRQSSGIHSGKTSPRTEEAALSGTSATPAGSACQRCPAGRRDLTRQRLALGAIPAASRPTAASLVGWRTPRSAWAFGDAGT
jgi:hypothetical protein